ncbi:hypothetical protein K493DRAFT_383612 [Basidiobolus meristosporus CBS 931.73]|uniref:Major facilitator superfamily (MFS) profile domain-containing protein n=1 Tax=Basidiobolus meristosporus CBS 931.73 TaxID=1314790 RepID=A0A1Y1XTM1_9FUNG|nr:hypothetical protein K493DRAFT_383612 [Basidiobolus meristosporus CBS 931.73]|eukprot:ORX89102.1 hypothetical protein K493DRAFT_383612 [Basidiobolus meristosporus CBS 931.73]
MSRNISAIHAFIFLIIAAFLLKGRVERPKRPFQLDFSALQDRRFVILLTTAFFEYFAYVIPFFLTPEYCTYAGFGSGAGGLFVVTAQITGVQRLGNALGLVFATTIVGNLVGTPIATALKGTAGGGKMEYIPPILFSGFVTLAAACCFLALHLSKAPQAAK